MVIFFLLKKVREGAVFFFSDVVFWVGFVVLRDLEIGKGCKKGILVLFW